MIKDKAQAFALARWNDFRRFTPGQKAVTIAAVLALVIGGYMLLTWKPATKYSPLYSNLAASDASAIVSKLDSEKIPYKLAGGGTEIMVASDQVDDARLKMSAAGLPGSTNTGYSLLDKEGVTTSEFKQQIDYQRAVEGELAKTIQSIEGVQGASVHLSIPKQDVFNDNTQQTTGSVMLTVTPGTQLTDNQVQSVAYLVSSSVPGLKTNAVAISDSQGNVLRAPGQAGDATASADTQAKATEAYNNRVKQSIQSLLDSVLGPNRAIVTANSQLDFNQTKTTKRTYVYDPKMPAVSKSENKEIYQGAGGNPGGTAGTVQNTDSTGTGTTSGSGNGNYQKTNTVTNAALGTVTQASQSAPGGVKSLGVSVAVDKNAPKLDVPALTSLVKSAVGFPGAQISLKPVPFDKSAATADAKAAKAGAAAAAAAASQEQLISYAKQGGLVLLIAGLFIAAVLASRKRKAQPAEPNDDVVPFDDPDDDGDDAPAPAPKQNELLKSAVLKQRDVAKVADERPQDVARALSQWINTKDENR